MRKKAFGHSSKKENLIGHDAAVTFLLDLKAVSKTIVSGFFYFRRLDSKGDGRTLRHIKNRRHFVA